MNLRIGIMMHDATVLIRTSCLGSRKLPIFQEASWPCREARGCPSPKYSDLLDAAQAPGIPKSRSATIYFGCARGNLPLQTQLSHRAGKPNDFTLLCLYTMPLAADTSKVPSRYEGCIFASKIGNSTRSATSHTPSSELASKGCGTCRGPVINSHI